MNSASYIEYLQCLMIKPFLWLGHHQNAHLFISFVLIPALLIYHWFNDNLESSYLSRIFRKDKYGIVIFYAVLSMLSTVSSVYVVMSWATTVTQYHREIFFGIITLSALQVCAVNFIFSNHTTQRNSMHQAIHFLGVVLLAAVNLAKALFLHAFTHDELPSLQSLHNSHGC